MINRRRRRKIKDTQQAITSFTHISYNVTQIYKLALSPNALASRYNQGMPMTMGM